MVDSVKQSDMFRFLSHRRPSLCPFLTLPAFELTLAQLSFVVFVKEQLLLADWPTESDLAMPM
jgi:hypothetical protein